VLPGDMK